MKFYNLSQGADIKENILSVHRQMLDNYSTQQESDEYKAAVTIGKLVEKFNFSQVQNIMENDPTAFCWLNSFAGKVYINVKNKKGYRYKLKESCLGSI